MKNSMFFSCPGKNSSMTHPAPAERSGSLYRLDMKHLLYAYEALWPFSGSVMFYYRLTAGYQTVNFFSKMSDLTGDFGHKKSPQKKNDSKERFRLL